MNRFRSTCVTEQPFPSDANTSLDTDFFSDFSVAGGMAMTAESDSTRSNFSGSHYALFAPLHYEPNYAYPLIVWLHGGDQDENQLKRVMPQISLRNYVAIAPRATSASSATQQSAFAWRQTEPHIVAAEQRVLECVAVAAEKFNVAPARIFLAGHDGGGTMAFRIAMRNPRIFAGVLSCGGPFPSGNAPLAQLHAIRRLSVLVGCSRESERYPTQMVCDDLRLLHSAGMSIMLREYPGADDLAPHMLADMDRWLMEQINSSGVGAAESRATSSPSGA